MKYTSLYPLLFLLAIFLGCSPKKQTDRTAALTGLWRGIISLQGQELPFHFRLSGDALDSLELILINGKEELKAGIVSMEGDTLVFPMHIFDTEIRAVLTEKDKLQGYWIKKYADDYKLDFNARKGQSFRFETSGEDPAVDVSGRWSVSFLQEDSTGAPNAVGIFQQKKGGLNGTFLTPTGDYRYLEGNVSGNTIYLSAFDGEHAFLFKAQALGPDRLEGMFWSGKSWEEKWIAVRDDSASLPPADSLTYLKDDYKRLDFQFPDLEGKPVSLADPKYQGKVVIVQLLGSWCPNCMDESKFLADWYKRNKEQDVAIIGLAYEKKNDFDYARKRLQKMTDKLDIEYDLLIAGTADKKEASKTLPMLNHVMAFPTTIFIDKAGNIRKIRTGFSGPGTGEAYEKQVENFNLFVAKLMSEPAPTVQAKDVK